MIDKIKVGTSVHSIVPVLSPYTTSPSKKNPLRITSDVLDENGNYTASLTIGVGSGITTGQYGLCVDAEAPLVADNYGLRLKLDSPALEASYNGLTLRIGSGLTIDRGRNLDINLKDSVGPLAIKYGLELVIGSDVYTDGSITSYRSLSADGYGLHLRLSTYTATNGERTYTGNAITPTEYGLSLKLGTGLLVEQDALDVKLSFVTQLSGGSQIPNNAITVIPGEGFGAPGITLKLQERVINGRSQTLLTTLDGGLDIDIDVLKLALGLS